MKGMTMKKFAMFGAAGLLAIGASGCVTTGDLEEVRAMAEQAAQDAAAAQQAANAAERKATAAQSTASEANARATRAEEAANAAEQCCKANTERMNRMFEKSMQK